MKILNAGVWEDDSWSIRLANMKKKPVAGVLVKVSNVGKKSKDIKISLGNELILEWLTICLLSSITCTVSKVSEKKYLLKESNQKKKSFYGSIGLKLFWYISMLILKTRKIAKRHIALQGWQSQGNSHLLWELWCKR